MKFDKERKETIIIYLLEKIQNKDSEISKKVSENFSINQNTVHTYINELVNSNIIRRVKRGEYELIKTKSVYSLERKRGELDSDTYAFETYFINHIKNMSSNIKSIWSYVFTEMTNNVIDHSQSDIFNIIVEQDYLTTTVAMTDNGIGIFKKIKEHFNFPTLDDAICELFKGKLTTDHINHSGEGIFFSSRMMDDFFIISDNKIFTIIKFDNSHIIDLVSSNIQGTCVVMSLSNYSHKEAKEVFDLYANDDGSFTKTKIPIKNIFESSPVSRSQAKRICNRLEKFKEVILDFDGVEWIGQGFAHQLFVVFTNAYPEIELIPINMNEDISKMYNHVRG
ncbi:MAG: STAS-like domain-containing protein [Lachnospiraceae bacterium]|nr:STAS-like domain-containing protein [Lachnospiraceae bacterium]